MKLKRRSICLVLACVLFVSLLPHAAFGAQYSTLSLGDKGSEVLALKKRMQALSYFSSGKFTEEYNDKMVERVKHLEIQNGLTPTGIATPELQALIFSDNVRSATQAPLITKANQDAFIHPKEIDNLPENVTADGFLADMSNGAFIYQSRDEGHWLYISDSVRIEITRWESPEFPLIWFESDIRLSADETLHTLMDLSAKKVTVKDPRIIAKDYGAVFAVSDDFYGYRKKNGVKYPGMIIRSSTVLSTKTRKAGGTVVPNLDVIALFADGDMKTFQSDEHTAEEYLAMGVTDTWAFGPILVQNGEMNPVLTVDKKFTTKDPRNAMGMIAPKHYLFLSVLGRQKDSVGVSPLWLAQRMQDLGCQEALNLDGGNSVALIFLDDMINKPENTTSKNYMQGIRALSSLIGVGTR